MERIATAGNAHKDILHPLQRGKPEPHRASLFFIYLVNYAQEVQKAIDFLPTDDYNKEKEKGHTETGGRNNGGIGSI